MAKEVKTKIQQPYDTEENWQASERILLEGEMAFSSDNENMYKVGNGKDLWRDLPYASRGSHAGTYNIEDTEGKYAFIVGNGTSDTNRSNAFTVDKKGNAQHSGNVESQKQIKGESINLNNKIDLLYDSSTESLNFVFK